MICMWVRVWQRFDQINASSPAPEGELEIKCDVRQSVRVPINITNPLEEAVDFDVELLVCCSRASPYRASIPRTTGY